MSAEPRTRLGVLGWPVAHSRSPAMHNAALHALELSDWRYQLLPVPVDRFLETVRALPPAGFRGANVTIPHKAAALAVASQATERARAIGAANTLLFERDGEIRADNTDAPALAEALPFDVRGRSALVLGAGGTARAAVWALLEAGAAPVRVWNRTAERAQRLCADLGGVAVAEPLPADLLVNCTASGLGGPGDIFKDVGMDADDLWAFQAVIDYVYADPEPRLVQEARARSLAVVGGLELLVGQGARSFAQFTGRAAPVLAMRAAVGG